MSDLIDRQLEEELDAPRQLMRAPAVELMLTPAFDLETAQSRLAELQKFVEFYMKDGEDFGVIPGTAKPTLYKSGADKLCDIYALADKYRVTNRTEDWDRNLFDYEVECSLISKRTGQLVATGLGSCNSYEGKYRWREAKRKCPQCGKETIIKGKAQYGGGYICWKKEGKSDGCGAKFTDDDQSIIGQMIGKTENEDIPTLKNTLLKMAKKRAKVDAVLSATRSSGLFTQDMDDLQAVESQENGHAPSVEQMQANAKAEEIVTVTPYKEGYAALSGKGLQIMKSNLDGQKKGFLGWKEEGNVIMISAGKVFDFKDMCEKNQVGTILMDAQTDRPLAPPKAVIPAMPELDNLAGNGGKSTDPVIMEAVRRSSKKPDGKEFLSVTWNGKQGACFKKSLWPHIEHHVKRPAMLKLESKGQYVNVVGIESLEGVPFIEEGVDAGYRD